MRIKTSENRFNIEFISHEPHTPTGYTPDKRFAKLCYSLNHKYLAPYLPKDIKNEQTTRILLNKGLSILFVPIHLLQQSTSLIGSLSSFSLILLLLKSVIKIQYSWSSLLIFLGHAILLNFLSTSLISNIIKETVEKCIHSPEDRDNLIYFLETVALAGLNLWVLTQYINSTLVFSGLTFFSAVFALKYSTANPHAQTAINLLAITVSIAALLYPPLPCLGHLSWSNILTLLYVISYGWHTNKELFSVIRKNNEPKYRMTNDCCPISLEDIDELRRPVTFIPIDPKTKQKKDTTDKEGYRRMQIFEYDQLKKHYDEKYANKSRLPTEDPGIAEKGIVPPPECWYEIQITRTTQQNHS
jgi:hypothetical protein